MSTLTTGPAAGHPPTAPRARLVRPERLDWLTGEVRLWRAAGLVDDTTAAAILAGYRPTRRLDLARLLLTLGAAFVGIGVIWLVASNLDQLPPATRFAVVAAFWLALLVGGEALRAGGTPGPVAGAARTLAALAFGAVVLQAAQSLQVPAYEPQLLAWWGLGALVHAYAVRATGPLVVGLLVLSSWLVWQVAQGADGSGVLSVLLVLFAAGTCGSAAAVAHGRWLPAFAAPWREIAAVLTLTALFVAALPYVTTGHFHATPTVVSALVLATVAAAAATAMTRDARALEALLPVALTGAGLLLVAWEVGSGPGGRQAGLEGWAHAGLGVATYVGAAAWFAVLGVLRDSRRLTWLAVVALVLFTTVQAFSVFAQIVQGALLFVVLGAVFAGTGWVADRGRRELARTIGDAA